MEDNHRELCGGLVRGFDHYCRGLLRIVAETRN
jgi:hypothetical protein